jgi:hypothetical protein
MILDALTSDNPHLSEPSKPELGVSYFRASPDDWSVPEVVEGYIRDSMAATTRRAYLNDLAHFEQWGGRIPCDPSVVAAYLAEHAGMLAVATLVRRLAAKHAGTRREASHRPHSPKSFAPHCAGLDGGAALRSARRVPYCAMSCSERSTPSATAPRTPATGRSF